MVKTSDVLLLGGALLGILYLKKRDNQISNIRGNAENYNVIQEINLDNITQSKSRIEQLTDIRSQIIGYERSVLDEKVSFLKAEIGKAQAIASKYQRAVVVAPLGRTASDMVRAAGGGLAGLQAAYSKLTSGSPKQALQAGAIGRALKNWEYKEKLDAANQFIDKTTSMIDELNAKQAELEQIV